MAAAFGSDAGACSVVAVVCCVSSGFGFGIGSGVVSGAAIAVSTPVESSYVGSCGSFPGCFGNARVVYEFVTTGTRTDDGACA